MVQAVPQNAEFPRDTANPFLGVHPRAMKTHIHPNTCTGMFTAAFVIPWSQKVETTQHPSKGMHKQKVVCICPYYGLILPWLPQFPVLEMTDYLTHPQE